MSTIVAGIGTSHSPLITMGPDDWVARGRDDVKAKKLNLSDGRFISYDDLLAEVGPRHADMATRETFVAQYDQSQRALDHQAAFLRESGADIVVVIGDDQGELFDRANMPAIAIYHGDEVIMHPWDEDDYKAFDWRRRVAPGYSMDAAHRHAGAPDYALGLIRGLMDEGVDLAIASEVNDPEKKGFGHAYGFVAERLFDGRSVPMVPVLLNTYFPPNVPTSARCYDVGQLLKQAIAAMPDDHRVAVVASGGLSHFVTDAELDRRVLQALAANDRDVLRSIPRGALQSGSSEILNWVMAGGALDALTLDWSDYMPVYRTPAGTGCGLAFATWRP